MRVINEDKNRSGRCLSSVSPGKVVRPIHQFHQDHTCGHEFLVVEDNGYLNERTRGKALVVNLRTGKLSVIMGSRECIVLNAEVVIRRSGA